MLPSLRLSGHVCFFHGGLAFFFDDGLCFAFFFLTAGFVFCRIFFLLVRNRSTCGLCGLDWCRLLLAGSNTLCNALFFDTLHHISAYIVKATDLT